MASANKPSPQPQEIHGFWSRALSPSPQHGINGSIEHGWPYGSIEHGVPAKFMWDFPGFFYETWLLPTAAGHLTQFCNRCRDRYRSIAKKELGPGGIWRWNPCELQSRSSKLGTSEAAVPLDWLGNHPVT